MPVISELSSAQGIRQSAERVNAALHEVVNQLPIRIKSPKDLARRLKVHRTLASRLLGALRMSDPLAVVTNIPGKQGLDTILRAAEAIIGSEPVGEARMALDEFETLVEHGLGGREVLDIALGAWLPETREKHELSCKQQIYRGLSGLAGACADVTIDAGIRYPSEDGEHANLVMVYGLIGLRRLSPGRDIPIGTLGMIPGVATPSGAVIQNLPGSSDPDGPPIIAEFSSSPLPPIREIRLGNYRQYLLPGEEIGNRSKVDIFTGLVVHNIAPLYRSTLAPPRRTGAAHMVEVPTKTILMDFFVEEQAAPLNNWQITVHRTGQRGGVDPNDPIREIDRMECTESIQLLGRGTERFGALEVARYPEIIRYVCDKLGLNSSQLIGHRCRVQYPLPHVQYSMGFELQTCDEAANGRDYGK
jgi:hypothetical protein